MRAMAELSPEYIRQQEALFRESSMVLVDTNIPKDSLRTIFTLARRFKLLVIADPTSLGLATRLKPYLGRIFMLVPNAAEAGVLCEREVDPARRRQVLDAAKCLVTQGVQIAIITLGEYGVCYATSETSGQIPAIRTEIADPTGAGDALTAAVIMALLNGIELDEALRLGVSAATLTLRHTGAVVPDLSLQALYDQLVI
jgi:pseudouridine kinase